MSQLAHYFTANVSPRDLVTPLMRVLVLIVLGIDIAFLLLQ
jgi:hypothetical protein